MTGTVPPAAAGTTKKRSISGALQAGTGIFVSKISGLVRESIRARYLGATSSIAADAFAAAFRIPNFLQTLLGEGVLSSSFIPVYSGMLAKARAAADRGAHDEARVHESEAAALAGAIAGVLGLIVAVVVLLGVTAAPVIVRIIQPGFANDPDPARYLLTVQLTRIFFPGAALFVLSAWCLAIFNSHHKFLFSYLASVVWNVAMIATFLWYGPRASGLGALTVAAAYGSTAGAFLMFVAQAPHVLKLVPGLRVSADLKLPGVWTVLRNVGPTVLSRGVVQISGFIDQAIAGLITGNGAVALLSTAQTVSMLPVSLFGMAVAAAELPAMSSVVGTDEAIAFHMRTRLAAGLRTIAFTVIPSAVAFVVLGDVIIRLLFQRGNFSATDTRYAWAVLAGSSIGLVASTLGRLYSQGFYALRDTRTPMRFAIIRVVLTTSLGWLFALRVPGWLGIAPLWGAAGLTATAGMAGWVEFHLLRRALSRRIGPTPLDGRLMLQLWGLATLAAAAGLGVKLALGPVRSLIQGPAVLVTFAVVYGGISLALGIPEARAIGRRFGVGR